MLIMRMRMMSWHMDFNDSCKEENIKRELTILEKDKYFVYLFLDYYCFTIN